MNAFKLKHALPCDRVKNAFLCFSYSVCYLQAMAILTECKNSYTLTSFRWQEGGGPTPKLCCVCIIFVLQPDSSSEVIQLIKCWFWGQLPQLPFDITTAFPIRDSVTIFLVSYQWDKDPSCYGSHNTGYSYELYEGLLTTVVIIPGTAASGTRDCLLRWS